jgi:hypothetical protein
MDEDALCDKESYAQAKRLNTEGKAAYIDILCSQSIAQNASIARAYEETYDESLSRAIGKTFEGPVVDALRALLLGRFEWCAAQT